MAEPYTDVDNYDYHRQLAIYDVLNPNSHSVTNSVTNSVTSSQLPVPDGWIIQQVPRCDGSRIDTYYIEPETGRRFRSRHEITSYLNGEEYRAYRSRPSKLKLKIKKSGDRMTITRAENMTPESKQIICAENFYHDPETGRKFRSLKDVEKYLTEGTIPTRSRSKRGNSLNYHERMLDFDEDKDNAYQLANVTPTRSRFASSFKLPDGWVVEEVPRKSNEKHIDRYYYEPETGRKFRSLKDVERYVTEGTIPTGSNTNRRNSLNWKNNKRKMIARNGKMLDFDDGDDEDKDNASQLVTVTPKSSRFSSSFEFPDGWIIEEVPRRSNELHIDRYYYEPGTQKKFRSLTSAQRHLAEQEENSSLPSIKNQGSYDLSKKTISRKEQCSSSNSPPSNINWVIPDTRGETWNPFNGDTPVPDPMKQQWRRRFTVSINNINFNAAISGLNPT